MSVPAIALLPTDPFFNAATDYYTMFPHEVSETKDVHAMDIRDRVRVPQATFEGLLNTVSNLRTSTPTIDSYLIVCHGLHDDHDVAQGVALPIAPDVPHPAHWLALDKLLTFVNATGAPSVTDMDAWGKNTNVRMVDRDGKRVAIRFPPGSVGRLVNLMRQLRSQKVRKIEFRSCTLGNRPNDVMTTIGQCFSARWVYAPDVHMAYSRVGITHVSTDGTFDRFMRQFPAARVFTNNADRLAILVQGRGVNRIGHVATTARDLSWFVDKFIWPGNNYPRNTQVPAPFFMAQMDVPPEPSGFALPLEAAYPSHLVFRGPLPGNQI